MATLRCPACGLVNFATEAHCKRCKQSLHDQTQSTSEQAPLIPHAETKGQPTPDSEASPKLDGIWRDGSLLVMTNESVLPSRCVRCNATAAEQYERKLSWNPVWINVMAFLSMFPLRSLLLFVISIILAFALRRTANIHVGLCESHQQKRNVGLIVGGGLIATGLGLGIYVAMTWAYGLIPWAILITLAGGFVAVLLKDTLAAKKIEEPYVWVKGVDKSFLQSLPALQR